jgi:hypothetical protein
MNQLLEIHRLGLEKNVEPTEAEQQALAEAEQRFLDNQKQYQQLNTELVQLNDQLRGLERRRRGLDERLQGARQPVQEEYQRLYQRHELKLAAIKLAVLLPLSVYREAYERFFCPICEFPIRRGPLKYVFWSRRSIKNLHFPP